MPENDSTTTSTETALAGAHPDLMPLAIQIMRGIPAGHRFTAAQLGELLPRYADDKPCRMGAVVRELHRRGWIEFHGYGPRAADGDWDTPARVWSRTPQQFGGAA